MKDSGGESHQMTRFTGVRPLIDRGDCSLCVSERVKHQVTYCIDAALTLILT